jgi:plasmid stability protein
MVLRMARTTLTIDDQLLRELKRKAAEQGRTLQAVTNDLLRSSLRSAETLSIAAARLEGDCNARR